MVTKSLPPRGAWIEILTPISVSRGRKSLPPRGAWIEISYPISPYLRCEKSLPPRGAWIEIDSCADFVCNLDVAPPTGSVD